MSPARFLLVVDCTPVSKTQKAECYDAVPATRAFMKRFLLGARDRR